MTSLSILLSRLVPGSESTKHTTTLYIQQLMHIVFSLPIFLSLHSLPPPSVLFTVTGHFIYVDRIRHAASDPYYDVTPEDSDIVVHAVHPESQRVLHGSELLEYVCSISLVQCVGACAVHWYDVLLYVIGCFTTVGCWRQTMFTWPTCYPRSADLHSWQ